jgi:cyclophilin family peptidyl-prolyl cis-trans isomerase
MIEKMSRVLVLALSAISLLVGTRLWAENSAIEPLGTPPIQATAAIRAEPIPFQLPPGPELARIRSAVLFTERGPISFELFPELAPYHVANLKYLADRGYFRNKVVDGFYPNQLVQLGAPGSAEGAQYRYSLPPEFSERHHAAGTLGMARSDNPRLSALRRSLPTQIHILLVENSRMNGDYTLFGRVIGGMDIVAKLRKGTRVKDLVVYVSP